MATKTSELRALVVPTGAKYCYLDPCDADIVVAVGRSDMRILVTTSPLYGHFFPMLPLIRVARAAGHHVVVATGPDLAAEVRRRDLELWQVGPSMADVLACIANRPPDPGADRAEALRRDAMAYFGEPGIARAQELSPLAAAAPPDVVIHEQSDFAGWEVAAALDVSGIAHGYGPHLPFTRQLVELIFAEGAARLGTPDRAPRIAETVYVDPWPASLQSAEEVIFRRVKPVRPEPEPVSPEASLPGSVLDLPYATTVYATFGTVFAGVGLLLTVIDAVRDLEVNLVVTTGHGVDPGSLGTLPAHVVAVPFLPQALLLPRCSAVVSHAGSGTVLGALAERLPQVCLPVGADQFVNAEQIARQGAGIMVPPDARTPETVRAALLSVLHEPSFSTAAAGLQSEVERMPPADVVLPTLLAGS
jgi:UDP:flavonoid glycosyltransferase YjiC (YdhE family)